MSDIESRETSGATVNPKTGLYDRALTEAELLLLAEAREVRGLDEEIAVLRVKLATLLAEHPDSTGPMLKAMEMLLRAVATRYRLSQEASDTLAGSVNNVLKRIGGAVWPELFS